MDLCSLWFLTDALKRLHTREKKKSRLFKFNVINKSPLQICERYSIYTVVKKSLFPPCGIIWNSNNLIFVILNSKDVILCFILPCPLWRLAEKPSAIRKHLTFIVMEGKYCESLDVTASLTRSSVFKSHTCPITRWDRNRGTSPSWGLLGSCAQRGFASALQLVVYSLAPFIVPCGLGGWTDGPSLLPVVQSFHQWEAGWRSSPVQWEEPGLDSEWELGCSIWRGQQSAPSIADGCVSVMVTLPSFLPDVTKCNSHTYEGPVLT